MKTIQKSKVVKQNSVSYIEKEIVNCDSCTDEVNTRSAYKCVGCKKDFCRKCCSVQVVKKIFEGNFLYAKRTETLGSLCSECLKQLKAHRISNTHRG